MKQQIPSYYSKNPKILFSPQNPESERQSEIKEILVNQKWHELKMKKKIREGIKATRLAGVCGFKTYFNFSKNFKKSIYDDSEKNDEVATEVVTIKYLLKDESAKSWYSSPWIGHKVEDTKDNIIKKFSIRGEDKDKVSILKKKESKTGDSDKYGSEGYIEYGCYYEIEDRMNEELFYIVEGIEKIFDKKELEYEEYDSMWDFLEFNEIPDEADTKSDYDFCKGSIRELNRYKKLKIDVAKKSVPKNVLTTAIDISPEQESQLTNSDPGAYIVLSPGQQLSAAPNAPIDNNIQLAEADVRSDIQQVLAQGPTQTSSPFIEKTATEIKVNEMASQEISSENRDKVEDLMASIAFKWSVLMEKNYTVKRTISLTGMSEDKFYLMAGKYNEEGKELIKGSAKYPFLVFDGEDIKSKCHCSIVPGSTQKETEASRLAKYQGYISIMGKIPQLAAQVDWNDIAKELTTVFNLTNENVLLKRDNPSRENELLSNGVFIEAKISEDHEKHLLIHRQDPRESESKVLHVLMHEMFKQQLQDNKVGEVVSQIQKMQDPMNQMTGQSLLGIQAPLTQPGQQPGVFAPNIKQGMAGNAIPQTPNVSNMRNVG